MKKFSFGLVWKSLKDAFSGFSEHKVTKLSASLAYYTTFSLAPLLVILISVTSFFLGNSAQGEITAQIRSLVGADAARQIEDMIRSAAIDGKDKVAAIVGGVALLIGASSVFGEMQDSINSIWGLKLRPKVGIMKLIKSRLLSFGLIGSLGFLLLVSLTATTVVEGLGEKLQRLLPGVSLVLLYVINQALTIGVVTVLFSIIFKVLPDARVRWKAVLPGAVFTTMLFLVGKFGISFYITKTNVASTYGAAGSLAVLLVWIYYSAIILYLGAEFTKAYVVNKGEKIVPSKHARWSGEPAVPGAKTKEAPSRTSPDQPGRALPPKAPQLAAARHPQNRHKSGKKAKPGMGTVLIGLVLYYLNTAGKKGEG